VPKILNAKELPNVPLKTWGDIGAFTAIRIRKLIRSGKLGGSYHSEYADKKKAGKAAQVECRNQANKQVMLI